jgi:hypothetical protein
MNLTEFQEIILKTNIEDWTKISCWGGGAGPSYHDSLSVWTKGSGEFHNIEIESHSELFSLKSNLNISVACGITHNDDFIEDWANSFADKKASSSFVDFFYCNQLVYRDIYVSVDGGRARIPLPDMKFDTKSNKVKSYTVPRDKFVFFKILNSLDRYQEYFERTKIQTVNEPWMT